MLYFTQEVLHKIKKSMPILKHYKVLQNMRSNMFDKRYKYLHLRRN